MNNSSGKTAVITGASYGIGRAMAISLARKGYDLVLIARNKKGLEETAKRAKKEGVSVQVFAANITKWQNIEKIVSKIKKVDVLYNGVANWVDNPLEMATFEEIDETINTVYKANVFVTKFFLPFLKKSQGVIINMISDWGLASVDAPSPMGSAKQALSAFGNRLQKEVKQFKVRVVNVYPTEVSSQLDIDDETQEDKKIRLKDLIGGILEVFATDKKAITQIYVSHLTEKLVINYS